MVCNILKSLENCILLFRELLENNIHELFFITTAYMFTIFEKYSFFSPILYGVEFFPYNWKIGVRKENLHICSLPHKGLSNYPNAEA